MGARAAAKVWCDGRTGTPQLIAPRGASDSFTCVAALFSAPLLRWGRSFLRDPRSPGTGRGEPAPSAGTVLESKRRRDACALAAFALPGQAGRARLHLQPQGAVGHRNPFSPHSGRCWVGIVEWALLGRGTVSKRNPGRSVSGAAWPRGRGLGRPLPGLWGRTPYPVCASLYRPPVGGVTGLWACGSAPGGRIRPASQHFSQLERRRTSHGAPWQPVARRWPWDRS